MTSGIRIIPCALSEMNPDACRDVMDRSRLPYDTGPDLNKVTNGLDELSLKKQLPLRQQATKPVLKYNTSMAKPVHLFSHGDGPTVRRDSAGVNLYTQNGMYYTGHTNGNLQGYTHEMSSSAARHPSAQSSNHIHQHINGRSTPSNPYVRPVSATEVAANINGDKARRMVEAAIAISNLSEKTATAFQAQTLQRNSFLRPLSGTGSNRDKPVATALHSTPGPSTSQRQTELSTSIIRQDPAVESKVAAKNAVELRQTKKTLFDFASTTSTTVVRPNINQNTTDNIQQQTESISQANRNLLQNFNSSYVRNPTYSPNKPYVNDTADSMSQVKEPKYQYHNGSMGNSHSSTIHSMSDTKYTSDLDESSGTPRRTDIVAGTLKKMPVTNTLTGTVYYRKSSLSDNLTRPGNHQQSVVSGNFNSSNASSNKIVSTEQGPLTSLSNSSSAGQKTVPQISSVKKTAGNLISNTRPALERANATLIGQSTLSVQDVTVSPQKATPDAESQQILSSKPPTGPKEKSGGQKQSVPDRGQLQAASKKKSGLKPRHGSGKGHLNSHDKKPSTKRGSLPTSRLEQRPLGDGAPEKLNRNLERRGKLAGDSDEEGEDETYEDGEFDDDEEEYDQDGSSDVSPSGERLPGDGEASVEDYDDNDDDDDEDALDNFEDNTSDGGSDGYSITSANSSLAGRPATAQSAGRVGTKKERAATLDKSAIRPMTASADVQIKPAFRFSLFNKIPPTLNFLNEGEKAEQLPWELRKLLKWKMSPITPIVVKVALARVGFRVSKRNHDWLGCFGKHMKAQCFKSMREYQMLNHFPGSFQIGRKDRLWRNLSRLQLQFGKTEFNFFPQTYVLPCDLKQLKRAWDEGNTKQKWIIKPPASARGIGIRVINKWTQIPRRKPVIVQKYLHRPYLINDSKFDMRIYVYVTSYDPLRIYVYDDGLARFASCKYSSSMKSLGNKFMHLTNYSVNKKNTEYTSNTDNTVCMGHKWSLKSLWNYLRRQGINTTVIWDNVRDLIIKTIISGDSAINSMTKSNCRSRYCCHELFGFDVLLDENLKPWILEVNISPSLHSNSPLDIQIKGGLIKDMLNLAGMRLPDERDVSNNPASGDFSAHRPLNKYCMDKRLFTNQLSPDERAKHAYFCQKHQDELAVYAVLKRPRQLLGLDPFPVEEHKQIMQSILDTLTPDDLRFLCESIDEDSRKGNFQRLFPTPHTHRYLRFFQAPRYYNLLLDQWVLRYNRMEQRGILLLQSYCDEGIHLENPTSNPRHQWTPPNSSIAAFRSPEVRVLGSLTSLNSARGSGSTAPVRGSMKKPVGPGAKESVSSSSLIQSSSSNSLTSLISSPQLHTPSPIGPISSPSR